MTSSTVLLTLTVLLLVSAAQNVRADAGICRDLFKIDVGLTSETIQRTIKSLARLKLELDFNQSVKSPIWTVLRSDYERKEAHFLRLLEAQHLMTSAQLLEEINREIASLQLAQTEIEKSDQMKKTLESRNFEQAAIDGSKAIFHAIKPGKFEMGQLGRIQLQVEITRPYFRL